MSTVRRTVLLKKEVVNFFFFYSSIWSKCLIKENGKGVLIWYILVFFHVVFSLYVQISICVLLSLFTFLGDVIFIAFSFSSLGFQSLFIFKLPLLSVISSSEFISLLLFTMA